MAHLKEYRQATELTSLFMFCIYLFVPVLAPYIKSMGFSDFHIGLIFAIFPLTLILSSGFFGTLSDSIGRKKVIMFGILFQIIAIVFYLIGSVYLVILARVLEAMAFAAVVFVGMARIQDSLDSKSRGKYSGTTMSLMYVGKTIAPVIGGLIADYWFIKGPFLFSAFALLLVLWIVAIHERFTIGRTISRSEFNIVKGMRNFLKFRAMKGMAILGVMMHASLPLTVVFIPIYIVEHFGLSYSYVGIAIFAMEFFMLFQFIAGSLCDRFNKAKLTLLGVAIFGICLLLLSLAPSYYWLLTIMLIMGIGGALWNVAAFSFMSDIGEGIHKEGFVVGTYASIAKIGELLSFILGGLIVQYFGIKYLMIIIGIFLLVGVFAASFFMFDKKNVKRKKI